MMRALLRLLFLLVITTFVFVWYTGGSPWYLVPFFATLFLWAVVWRSTEDGAIDRYAAAHIRAAEAQCRTEELL